MDTLVEIALVRVVAARFDGSIPRDHVGWLPRELRRRVNAATFPPVTPVDDPRVALLRRITGARIACGLMRDSPRRFFMLSGHVALRERFLLSQYRDVTDTRHTGRIAISTGVNRRVTLIDVDVLLETLLYDDAETPHVDRTLAAACYTRAIAARNVDALVDTRFAFAHVDGSPTRECRFCHTGKLKMSRVGYL